MTIYEKQSERLERFTDARKREYKKEKMGQGETFFLSGK
jgi:hypothetical protein